MELLLPFSDPKANDSEALRYAAYNGYKEMVKMLLPVSDPNAEGSGALQSAARGGYEEIVELLIPVSDVEAACEQLDESEISLVKAMEADFRMKELQASTVQIPQSFKGCVDQARSDSQGTAAIQRAQARRL